MPEEGAPTLAAHDGIASNDRTPHPADAPAVRTARSTIPVTLGRAETARVGDPGPGQDASGCRGCPEMAQVLVPGPSFNHLLIPLWPVRRL
jgi:hypothetical protein